VQVVPILTVAKEVLLFSRSVKKLGAVVVSTPPIGLKFFSVRNTHGLMVSSGLVPEHCGLLLSV
jgi:hypothetical protein